MSFVSHVIIMCGIYVILAASLNLIMGLGGMFNMGQGAFYGIGAYAGALLTLRLGIPFPLDLLLSGLVAGTLGALIGFPAIRLKGDYLAFTTYGFAVVVYTMFNNWISLTRGPMGLPGVPRPAIMSLHLSSPAAYMPVVVMTVAIVLFIMRRIVDSPFGKSVEAIREDEVAALAAGKNVAALRVTVFCVGAFFSGIAGSLYVRYIGIADPSGFTTAESFLLVTMVIFGGLSSLWGSVLGACLLVIIPEILRFAGIPSFYASQLRNIIYGVVLVIVIINRPQGLLGKLRY